MAQWAPHQRDISLLIIRSANPRTSGSEVCMTSHCVRITGQICAHMRIDGVRSYITPGILCLSASLKGIH